jgi:hypothetical protein
MIRFLLLAGTILFSTITFGQVLTVSGTLQDRDDHSPVAGATVRLFIKEDTTPQFSVITSRSGRFEFKNIDPSTYRLRFSSVGFEQFDTTIVVSASPVNLGTLYIGREAKV